MPDLDTRVRVGIVGLGGMGTNHAANIDEMGHDVVAGTDVVPESRRRFAGQFDAAVYEEFEAMYEDEDLDAVFVTTPNKFHEPATVAALESGYDVLCEKPLAHSLDAAERIVEAADRADGFCMVGFHNRFSTPVSVFKEFDADGEFGDLSHVEANYIRRRGIPGVGSWFTDRDLAGGGALMDIGVHALDLSLYLLGYPDVEEVLGVTRSDFGTQDDYVDPDGWGENWAADNETFDVEDSVTALVRCADGSTISLDVSWAAEQESCTDFVVRGTDGGAEFDFNGDGLTIRDTGRRGTDHYSDTEIDGSLDPAGYVAQDRRFVEGVLAGEAPAVNTAEQALTVQRLIDAIYRSSEDGEAKRVVEERAAPVTEP